MRKSVYFKTHNINLLKVCMKTLRERRYRKCNFSDDVLSAFRANSERNASLIRKIGGTWYVLCTGPLSAGVGAEDVKDGTVISVSHFYNHPQCAEIRPSFHIIEQIEEIVKKGKKSIQQWILTTSPRTPKEFIEDLRERKLSDLKIYHYKDTKPGWVEEMLLASEYALVTPDSISMVYEALSANCKVAVLELLESTKNDKVARNISLLKEERYILGLEMFAKSEKLSLSKLHNQAEICANAIEEKFL